MGDGSPSRVRNKLGMVEKATNIKGEVFILKREKIKNVRMNYM